MESRPKLRFSMLSGFSISCIMNGQEKKITEQYRASRRMWLFLQYMVIYHDREVTQEELLKVLWWDDESSNPANAMKTTLHRARAVLEELGFSDGRQRFASMIMPTVFSRAACTILLLSRESFFAA